MILKSIISFVNQTDLLCNCKGQKDPQRTHTHTATHNIVCPNFPFHAYQMCWQVFFIAQCIWNTKNANLVPSPKLWFVKDKNICVICVSAVCVCVLQKLYTRKTTAESEHTQQQQQQQRQISDSVDVQPWAVPWSQQPAMNQWTTAQNAQTCPAHIYLLQYI